jgi:hypothetical protein
MIPVSMCSFKFGRLMRVIGHFKKEPVWGQ